MTGVKLLVKAKWRTGDDQQRLDNTTPPGVVVAVHEPQEPFGRAEDKRVWLAEGRSEASWPGEWWVIEMTGMTKAQAQQMLGPETDENDDVTHKFKYRMFVNEWAPAQRQQLDQDGFVNVQFNNVKQYLRRQKVNSEFNPQ